MCCIESDYLHGQNIQGQGHSTNMYQCQMSYQQENNSGTHDNWTQLICVIRKRPLYIEAE